MKWINALAGVDKSAISELLGSNLSYGIYEALAGEYLSKGVMWSFAVHDLRSMGADIDFAKFGNAFFHEHQVTEQRETISGRDAYEVLTEGEYIERPLSQPVKYRYIGEFTYIDDETGAVRKEYKSYYANEALSIADAGQLLYDKFDFDRYPQYRTLESIRVVNIEHNEGWGY